jgi:hypothetical protein
LYHNPEGKSIEIVKIFAKKISTTSLTLYNKILPEPETLQPLTTELNPYTPSVV